MMLRWGSALLVLAMAPGMLRADEPAAAAVVTDAEKAALDRISADSLRGHLSFLASDLLDGRGTPSRGLDLAAEYIAAQFRRAGLEPIGDDGYFQTADWKYLASDPSSFACEVKVGAESIRILGDKASGFVSKALDLPASPTFKVVASDADSLAKLTPELVQGKVVLAEVPHPYKVSSDKMRDANRDRLAFLKKMDELKPSLIVDVERDPEGVLGLRRDLAGRPARPPGGPEMIRVHSAELAKAFDALPAGPTVATVSLRVDAPTEKTAKVRNVLGLLRGSDPTLKETYVILSAHYDHLGIGPQNTAGDRIFNGANDDGSGTVSVVEIASALATLSPRPRRSLIFATFYGEEHGLIGSKYYTDHPIVPIDKTVAAVNLEQVGRTDDSEGPRVSAATVTGYSFSDVGPILHKAGAAVGVNVYEHPTLSDPYFLASDNASLARAGVPAHTISVAYAFPDYHGADDEWEKVDYVNMAKVDRMAALGLLKIANGDAPAWNKDNPKAAKYREKAPASR